MGRGISIGGVVAFFALLFAISPLFGGQKQLKPPADSSSAFDHEETSPLSSSVLNGEKPPGRAMSLSPGEARKAILDAIAKKFVGEWAQCALMICAKAQLAPPSEVHVRLSGFEFVAGYVWTGGIKGEDDKKVSVAFDQVPDYVAVALMPMMKRPKPLYILGYVSANKKQAPFHMMKLLWTDQNVAQQFADGFNRLVYYAHHGSPNSPEEFLSFASEAKAWRENPQKPQMPAEVDRERILAENSIREKDLDGAIQHFEAALQIFPMWPEAWFNSALIYGEMEDYKNAANAMKHYLELVPNAPDAAAAREKMIIWEDKIKR